MARLHSKVAVVTGASRGVGQGIALVLGEEGATVYVTGRSVRFRPTKPYPDTIDETAEMVTARGGIGIAVRCDHTIDEQVAALFERVKQEQGRLDILVNNVWGGYENMENYNAPFWEQPLWRWQTIFDMGARAHFVASRLAVPLMLPQRHGLIVCTTYYMEKQPGDLVSLAKAAVNGLVNVMAHQLRKHKIAVVGVAPTRWVWSRSDLHMIYEALDKTGNLDDFFKRQPRFKKGESPEYTGRAVAALATDRRVMRKSSEVFRVDDLAREYGFTDIGGWRPG